MPSLKCEISQTLMDALEERARATGEPFEHIVMRALADHLEVPHATLFQVSTSGALVEGISQGVVTVGELKRHGDLGLGTFADLDGEMVVLDGRFWSVPGVGAIREAADSDLAPFAVVTDFHPERTVELQSVSSIDDLLKQLDALRQSDNLFFAVRIDGRASHVHTRAVCKKAGAGLVDAAASQAEFHFADAIGTLVGFWTPAYAKTVNIAGWHLHFLSDDRSGGGHLLDIKGSDFKAQIEHLDDFRMAIPESAEFLKADLTKDPTRALNKAERA
ncbi:MAG TPA: acetolactate decarboxylase [Candidatus Binataceae bacterium]|nr:acetolactate decarboxylase [Candidatus Binataceae bacterium]